jgi:hypothetical protein
LADSVATKVSVPRPELICRGNSLLIFSDCFDSSLLIQESFFSFSFCRDPQKRNIQLWKQLEKYHMDYPLPIPKVY